MADRPPTSILNADAPTISNDAAAPCDSPTGVLGSELKSWAAPLVSDAITYSASDGWKVPPSSVEAGAVVRLTAPSTACSSNTLSPKKEPPSTSKKVM